MDKLILAVILLRTLYDRLRIKKVKLTRRPRRSRCSADNLTMCRSDEAIQ